MPSSRATAISEDVSIVNVTRPSTSAGVRPQSASACRTASTESWSSERPDSLENSVAPMPAMGTTPRCAAAGFTHADNVNALQSPAGAAFTIASAA